MCMGSRRRHMATPKANMLPFVYSITCINVFAITRSIMEARTQGRRNMCSRGRSRGRVWDLGGGRIWNLSYGVRPSNITGPRWRGPSIWTYILTRRGSTPPKIIKNLIKFGKKTEIIRLASNSEVAEGGGGGGLVTLVEIEFQQHYL